MKTKLLSLIMMISLSLSLNAQQTDYCLGFDGVASRVKYTNDAKLQELDGATDYTIECWVYPTSSDIHNRVLLKRWYSFALTMYQNNNRRVYFTRYLNNGADKTYVNTSNDVLNLNQWNHIAVVNNSTDNTLKIFVNGVNVTLDDSGNPGDHTALTLDASPGASANFYVGYGGVGTVPFAYIDKIRVKTVAESLSNLHTSDITLQPYTPDADTILLLNFNEGTGTTTVNDVNSVDAELQCRGGCAEIPTWHEIAADMAVGQFDQIDFSVYPNPVQGNKLTVNANEVINNISILNIDGKVVFSADYKELNNSAVDVDLSGLKRGVYLIKTTTVKGIGVQKVLKK